MIRAREAALVLAVGLAVASLPLDRLSAAWLAAASLPALVASGLRIYVASVLLRRVAAVLLQLAAVVLALRWGRPGAGEIVAAVLLPPIVYLALRRRGHDAAWATLASLGLVVAGLELGVAASLPLLGGWLAAAAVVLLCDGRARMLARQPYRAITGDRTMAWRSAALVLCACLLVALALRDALAPLSRHLVSGAVESTVTARRQGLPERFDLGSPAGTRILLSSDRHLRVRSMGGTTPPDLYLRYAYFDVAGLERWETAAVRSVPRPAAGGDWQWRPPVAGLDVEAIEILPLEGRTPLVFLVPGAFRLEGLTTVEGDPVAGWLRVAEAERLAAYRVHFQSLRTTAAPAAIDPAYAALAELPSELKRPELRRVASQLLAGAPSEPARLASFLERRLAERYRYALVEPKGPYRQALLNFLLGDGQGYCMHFAAAMAVLLRQRGVPCRLGVGLFGGEPDLDGEPAARLYGAADAHAWVEVPLAGLGWVVFDPTPPTSRGLGAALIEGANPGLGDTEPASSAGEAAALVGAGSSPLGGVWIWALLLLMWLAIFRPGLRRQPLFDAGAPAAARPARRLLLRILRALARAGYPRPRLATLERYLALLPASLEPERAAIASAFAAYQEIRFGARRLDAERQTRLAVGLAAARRTQPNISSQGSRAKSQK